ncbi:PREDICTED: uncharacterized protein LOC109211342 [Nicotiana attenuata]|uniref:uncharacterized protein LOC109211342 n=1 Tax=Nicotiana attenuata TaxID=49451 RepID=UPI00090523E7|nr:PREDICTED: uncharacterized protein LOC109211342 [Nicotiana attenuata]
MLCGRFAGILLQRLSLLAQFVWAYTLLNGPFFKVNRPLRQFIASISKPKKIKTYLLPSQSKVRHQWSGSDSGTNNSGDKMCEGAVPKLGTTIHITALDGIINVNSLFTLAVFIGLAWNPHDLNNSLATDTNCFAKPKVAEDLVAFHVYSFSCFLFSSLIALCLKQAIRLAKSAHHFPTIYSLDLAQINKNALRVGYLVSAAGSVCGSVFLMLALINVVQIKLGILGCGSKHTYGAVIPLVIFVPLGLLINVCTVFYAFTR